MGQFYESKVVALIGFCNGVNKSFTAPGRFRAGTFRLVWNGQVYEPADERFGWAETSDQTIETLRAPRAGDLLQGFYQEKDPVSALGLDDVRGSPFDPNGVIP